MGQEDGPAEVERAGVTHDEVLRTIESSDLDEWHVIMCWGEGPSYLDQMQVADITEAGSGQKRQEIDVASHTLRAAFKPDLSLNIAAGLRPEGDERLSFDWANFPDPKIRASLVDVFWNGALVYRDQVLTVDGGRAVLPWPHPIGTSALDSVSSTDWKMRHVQIGNMVTPFELALARLVHGFERGPREFDRYFSQSGIFVEPAAGE